MVDSGYLDIFNSGGWELGIHTLCLHVVWAFTPHSGCVPRMSIPKQRARQNYVSFPNLPSEVDYAVSFPQHSIHWGSDKGSLNFKGRKIHFSSPWQGNGRTFGIQNIDAASYFYKIQFSTVCHLATQYTFLPLTHLSLKIHKVSSDHGWELCQACSKPETQAPFIRELEWKCDRGQKTSWGQGTYMKGQLGMLRSYVSWLPQGLGELGAY